MCRGSETQLQVGENILDLRYVICYNLNCIPDLGHLHRKLRSRSSLMQKSISFAEFKYSFIECWDIIFWYHWKLTEIKTGKYRGPVETNTLSICCYILYMQ